MLYFGDYILYVNFCPRGGEGGVLDIGGGSTVKETVIRF